MAIVQKATPGPVWTPEGKPDSPKKTSGKRMKEAPNRSGLRLVHHDLEVHLYYLCRSSFS